MQGTTSVQFCQCRSFVDSEVCLEQNLKLLWFLSTMCISCTFAQFVQQAACCAQLVLVRCKYITDKLIFPFVLITQQIFDSIYPESAQCFVYCKEEPHNLQFFWYPIVTDTDLYIVNIEPVAVMNSLNIQSLRHSGCSSVTAVNVHKVVAKLRNMGFGSVTSVRSLVLEQLCPSQLLCSYDHE